MQKNRARKGRESGIRPVYVIAGISMVLLIILAVTIAGRERNPAAGGGNQAGMVQQSAPADGGNVTGGEITDGGGQQDVAGAEDGAGYVTVGEGVASGREVSSGSETIDRLYGENRLRPADLDFWGMYPKEEDNTLGNPDVDPEQLAGSPSPTPTPDPSEDGKHTLVTRNDGTGEWVQINPYITKNTYDPMKLIQKGDRMGYYEEEREVSYFGVDISKYNGEVDFAALKNDGVDFVMIRLGTRGYGSGEILLDENYEANITAANEAGLPVGVYFFSQAVSIEEAAEEAAFVIQHLANHQVIYPVAFDMEFINNDTSRIDSLKREAKTAIADTFLSSIQLAGYTPILYGTKEWLVEQIDLTKLMAYDVWLSQQSDLPDYPYKYQLWQYSLKGSVAGVTGEVDLNISFVDYTAR